MTIATDNTNFTVYVTHVDADGKLLQIFGQIDQETSETVEKIMQVLTPQFAQGRGCPTHPGQLSVNSLCCAMFEQAYYRAKILEIFPTGAILVKFIDYGNNEMLVTSDIRIIEAVPEGQRLLEIPSQATEYILSNVMPRGETWDSQIVSTIRKNTRYTEHPAKLVTVVGRRRLINLYMDGQDLGGLLVNQNIAQHAAVENYLRAQQAYAQQVQQAQQAQIPMANPMISVSENQHRQHVTQETPMAAPYASMRHIPPASIPRAPQYQTNPSQENWRVHPPPGTTLNALPSRHQPPSPPVIEQESSSFRTRVLDIGTQHEVKVSFVENGPLMFAVQTRSTAMELENLMKHINAGSPRPLAEPPLIGSVCLGRDTVNKCLRRAVVGKVTENCCKVHYVDFGYSEILPYTEIYQLPRQFINPNVLSIRFTLSNMSDLNVTEEVKEYFKILVSGKALNLQVRPSEGSPLIQYGDLYENGRNIRDILLTAFPHLITTWPGACKLNQGAREIVTVMYVESCNKFFVQLDTDALALEALKSYIDEYVKTAPPFKPIQLQAGLHCLALSSVDSQWYRAEITKLSGDTVTVFYVDYGNDETIPATSIRSIQDSNVTKLRAQAIRCILNGFERELSSEEMDNRLEEGILTKQIAMDVINVIPAGPIVDLYDTDEPMTNILHKLKRTSNGNVGMMHEPYSGIRENPVISSMNSRSDDQTDKRNNTHRVPPVAEINNYSAENSHWNNRKDEDIEPKRYENRGQYRGNDAERTNDRFARDDGRDRFPRDGPRQERNDRYDRSGDSNGNIRGSRDSRDRGGRSDRGFGNNRFAGNNSRPERNGNLDKSWSDKDSDTSSRGSGRNGRRGSSGGRGGRGSRRDGGNGRMTSGRDNDRDSDRNNKSYARSNGTPRTNNRDFGDRNEGKQFDNWSNKKPETQSTIRIPPPNITVDAVKNCVLVFVNSPTDFYVQLTPDNAELDAVMTNIASTYESGGKVLQRSAIKQGVDCVAQYSEDSMWYRATVQSVESSGAKVLFVDYGNVEIVEFEKIKQLDIDCSKLAAQAVGCKLLAASKTTWETSEIEKFSELADGKNLEAEFVARENEVYEVVLREIEASDKYINEEFSNGADFAQAKQMARNKRRTGTTQSSLVGPADYASMDEKWSVATIQPASKQNVDITWFTNPDNFWCQTLEQKDELTSMMHEMQRVYPKRQAITEPLQVGSAVIAVYADDELFYRAEILELNKARGNIVRYIDFGNCAIVEPRQTYRVEKRFMKLPKQAVNCCLKNVVPANGTSWATVNKEEIAKCFDVDKTYECSFHDIKDSKHFVSLNHEGVDVAGLMVDKSIASFAVSGPVVDEEKAIGSTDQSPVEDLPRFDISLLAGQVLRVKVSSVSSVTKFHIQLPSAAASDKIIDEYMADKDPKVMPRLLCREVCLGAGCLVKTDEGWRRAVVVNCSRTTGFDVRLIDTGENDEIPLDCMLALPGQLSVMQNQAVECCLKNATSSLKVDEKLRDRIENTTVIVAIEQVDNNRLIVELYDSDGNKIKIFDDEVDRKICPICPMPVLSSSHKVLVSHADNSNSVWLKRLADIDTDAELLGQLFEFYNTHGDETPVIPEILCAALSSDGNWYRAKILQTTETGVLVHFLDYGNTEEVTLESLKALNSQFYEPSQLAIEASLTVTLSGSPEEQQETLKTHIVDQEFTATFFNVRQKWVVELTNDEGKISDKLASLDAVEVSKNKVIPPSEIPEMIVGGRYKVLCPHSDSPAQFFLQREEEIPIIEQLQEKLQLDAPNYPALEGIPEVNTQCIAMYSVDEQWYRAEVLDADEDITTIRFIDYGNTDVVDTNSGKIKQIPDSLNTTKRYAIKCRLDVIPYGADDWTPAATEWFEGLATSTENMEALVIADGAPKRVELFFGDKSAVDELIERNYATKINTEEDLIDEIIEREVNPRAAYVSHAVSPNEFSIQQEQYVGELEVLADRCIVADMFPKLEEIKEGMLCVAKFPEDQCWYRARVVSHADAGTEVIYIDYGNSAISTELREIPEDLAALPPFSKRCCLALPEGIERWSEKAEVEFVTMAADGATTFLLDVLEENDDISVVRLTRDDKDIVEHLKELCENPVPIIEERLSPLGEENSPNVLVSHVNSPSEFWTQAESAITELETMANHLAAAESFLPLDNIEEGTICAAKFPEDELWYRAKVLSHGDAGTDVLYIDYGNSATTTELRVLPEDIVNISPLSTCCSLRMPEDVESWSKEACEKFFELVAEGATMFQYKILDDKEETTHISLSIEGNDIVEILAPLCEKKIQHETISSEHENDVEQIPSEICNGHQTVSFEDTISEEQISSEQTSGVGITNVSDSTTVSSFYRLESSSGMESSSETSTMVTSKSQTASITTTVQTQDSSMDENGSDLQSNDGKVTTIIETFKEIEQLRRPKTPLSNKIVPGSISRGLSKEDIILGQIERRNSIPLEDKIVPGSINKGNGMAMGDSDHNETDKLADAVEDTKNLDILSPLPTRKLSIDEKILPGSLSRGESPVGEPTCPSTPKTPHSEKLVAGVVNLQEKLAEFEIDESLSLVVEENIPQ